jgi:hypothetical protein
MWWIIEVTALLRFKEYYQPDKVAEENKSVKAVVLRIDSPGNGPGPGNIQKSEDGQTKNCGIHGNGSIPVLHRLPR